MKNTFGYNLSVTLFGESHGDAIGCVIDGLAPGIKIDHDHLKAKLDQRRARGGISTPRQEGDEVIFLSGIKDGFTEGTPVALIIKNEAKNSSDYSAYENTPRPSHADYTAECKYHGFQDKRGGGHFSGRLTAPLVAAGAIISRALEDKGIYIGTHISRAGGISDREFGDLSEDIAILSKRTFPVLDDSAATLMTKRIEQARADGDSVGGVLECAITGVPAGVGEPWFDTLEGVIAHAVFSIPGVKGVEFGAGFSIADKRGSEANDPFTLKNGRIETEKNSSGGINGGISNGMPIIFRAAIRPTPSISLAQHTVDMAKLADAEISIKGRHDPCIAHRARAAIDAVCAIAVADMLVTRYGTDYLGGQK